MNPQKTEGQLMQEIERFRAVSDDGHETTLIVYQEYIDAEHHGDPTAKVAGLKQIWTVDGFVCNLKDDGLNTFEIVNDPVHPRLVVSRV